MKKTNKSQVSSCKIVYLRIGSHLDGRRAGMHQLVAAGSVQNRFHPVAQNRFHPVAKNRFWPSRGQGQPGSSRQLVFFRIFWHSQQGKGLPKKKNGFLSNTIAFTRASIYTARLFNNFTYRYCTVHITTLKCLNLQYMLLITNLKM